MFCYTKLHEKRSISKNVTECQCCTTFNIKCRKQGNTFYTIVRHVTLSLHGSVNYKRLGDLQIFGMAENIGKE